MPWLIGGVLAMTLVMSLTAPIASLRPLFVTAAVVQGGLVLLAWRSKVLSIRQVLLVALLLRAIAFWLPPVLSDDVWRYAWDGLVQTYGISPYAHEPRDEALAFLHDSPAFERMNSQAYYSVYPPIPQMVFFLAGLADRAGLGVESGVYLIKLMLACAELAALLLLARMIRPRSLVLYAWHPLVVLESAGQAHTEALLILCLVACLWAYQRGHARLAGAALAAGVMVKLYPLVLLPFLWRRMGWRSVWPALLVMGLTALPYASLEAAENVRISLGLYVGRFEFNALPYFLVRDLANWLEPSQTDLGKLAVGQWLQTLFLLSVPILLWLDGRRRWSLDKTFGLVLGMYFVCSTTVHPWYLLGLLALPWTLGDGDAERVHRPQWSWLILALLTLGTYLRYSHGDGPYYAFTWIAWLGWLILLLVPIAPSALEHLMRFRARGKFRILRPHLTSLPPDARVLDLGAGEGYVGEAIARQLGLNVVLADVVDFRRADLPLIRYDGQRLPLADEAFDGVILYFVLHHCQDPRAVLAEALRVCGFNGGRVIIVESVYRRPWEHRLLDRLDRLANRLRSGGRMNPQEMHLHFRPIAEWTRLVEELGGRVEVLHEFAAPPHRQALLVVTRRT